MADVDYSIAAKVQPPKFDLMGTAMQATQLGQGMLNNRLLGLQVAGKQALGQLIGANTDPQGNTDWKAVSAQAAQSPAASIMLPEIQKQVIDREIAQQQLAGTTLDVQAKRVGIISNAVGSLLSDPEDLTPEKVKQVVTDRLLKPGVLDPQSAPHVASLLQQIDGKSPSDIRKIITQYGQMADMTMSRIQTQYAQGHGGITPESDVEGAPVLVPGPNGTVVPSKVLKSQAQGVMASGAPIRTGAPQTAEGVPIPQAGMPAYSVTKQDGSPGIVTTGDAARAAATGAPGAAPPVIQTGPTAGVTAGLTAQAGDAVKMAQGWREAADRAPDEKAQLLNLRDQIGKFSSGPNATWQYRLKALATQLGVAPPQVKNEVGAQEEFNKLASQFINSQVGVIGGGGTDSKLEAAMHGSPNELLSSEGAMGVTGLMLGLVDAKVAKAAAWQKWLDNNHTPDSAGQFQTQWNKLFNPRVFQSVYMTPQARSNMLQRMTKDERAKFQADWTAAKKFGWIQ